MKRTLNILHFSLYVIENKLHFLFNKINPALLLYKIPSIKNRMKEKYGIENPTEWYNRFWTDKKDGFSLWFSGGWLIGIIALIFISIGKIAINITNPEIVLNYYYFILLGGLSYLICYFFVFKNDGYLKYFDEFKNWTKTEKRKNVLLSLGFIIGVIALFFSSLLF
jgi:hypothetical protein